MKKKYGVLIGVVAFLALTVFVNSRVNKRVNQLPTPSPTLTIALRPDTAAAQAMQDGEAVEVSYFETFRLDRQSTRDKELEYLEALILHDKTDEETLIDAQQRKLALVDNMEKEFCVEAMVKAKGFSDVAVTFHPGSLNIVVQVETLSEQEVAQVLDIACRETGEQAKNIKIIPSK